MTATRDLIRALRDAAYRNGLDDNEFSDSQMSGKTHAAESALLAHVEGIEKRMASALAESEAKRGHLQERLDQFSAYGIESVNDLLDEREKRQDRVEELYWSRVLLAALDAEGTGGCGCIEIRECSACHQLIRPCHAFSEDTPFDPNCENCGHVRARSRLPRREAEAMSEPKVPERVTAEEAQNALDSIPSDWPSFHALDRFVQQSEADRAELEELGKAYHCMAGTADELLARLTAAERERDEARAELARCSDLLEVAYRDEDSPVTLSEAIEELLSEVQLKRTSSSELRERVEKAEGALRACIIAMRRWAWEEDGLPVAPIGALEAVEAAEILIGKVDASYARPGPWARKEDDAKE